MAMMGNDGICGIDGILPFHLSPSRKRNFVDFVNSVRDIPRSQFPVPLNGKMPQMPPLPSLSNFVTSIFDSKTLWTLWTPCETLPVPSYPERTRMRRRLREHAIERGGCGRGNGAARHLLAGFATSPSRAGRMRAARRRA